MDRCALAYQLHREGNNCAQAVAGSFADLAGMRVEQAMSLAAGFGGGVGGSHEELCGSISGGVLALGMLYPDNKKRCYAMSKEFRKRFEAVFGRTCCKELLAVRPSADGHTPAAARLGVTAHCSVMVVTAVELLEELLQEAEKQPD